jgi:acetyl esterase/lipase
VSLDRQAHRFLEMLAVAGRARGRYEAAEERREALTHLANLVDPPGMVEVGGVRDHLLAVHDGHISLRTYSPLGKPERSLPGMLFFHGGGWVAGSLDTHDGFCRRLANETGCRVIAVDYRLAPLHPFPYGLADAWAALNFVLRNPRIFGIDPERVGVAGDSAGATLAAVLCRMARDAARDNEPAPPIAFQLLICPILDVHRASVSRHELADGYFLDREALKRDLELYLPEGIELTDVRLSPLRAEEFADLPPAFIHTAQFDPFAEEGEAYAQRLGGFGVQVHGRAHAGMVHYFYCMPRMIPYALEAVKIIGSEIRYAVKLPANDRRVHRRFRPQLVRA